LAHSFVSLAIVVPTKATFFAIHLVLQSSRRWLLLLYAV